MKHSLLVTRPNFDLTTRYISVWAQKIIKLAQDKGCPVFDLYKDRASRKVLESVLRKKEPSLVFLNGHGDYGLVCGQDNEEIIAVNTNETVLHSKVAYTLSCCSGKLLGPSCINAGAEAYIGYDEEFIFLYDERSSSRPENDQTAGLFLDPSNQVMISLLKNHTPAEAHASSRKAYLKRIKKLLSSQASKSDGSVVRYLIWDMQHQVCCTKVDK